MLWGQPRGPRRALNGHPPSSHQQWEVEGQQQKLGTSLSEGTRGPAASRAGLGREHCRAGLSLNSILWEPGRHMSVL